MRLSRASWTILILATATVILVVDVYTPPGVQVASVVIVPVVLAAWRFGLVAGVALAVGMLVLRVPWHMFTGDPSYTPAVALANLGLRGTSFVLVAVLTARARTLHDSLNQANAKLGQVRAVSNDAVWIEDVASGVVEVNARWAPWLGDDAIARGVVPADDLLNVVHPDDRPQVESTWRTARDGTVDRLEMEFRLRTTDGGWSWVLARGAAIDWDAAGRARRLAGVLTDISARKAAEASVVLALAENEHLVTELRDALDHVKTLSGLIPICSSCKKIRDDHGFWQRIEAYIAEHTDATFTHGLCPDCIRRLYPDYADGVLGRAEPESQAAHHTAA